MYFTSAYFVIFLTVLFALYFLCTKRQWQVLLAASMIFYAFSGPHYLLYIITTIITVYYCALRISILHGTPISELPREERKAAKAQIRLRQRKWLIAALVLNLGILAVIKYTAFVVSGISAIVPALDSAFFRFALPMGISFYTFQSVGYLIDVYRGKYPAESNPFKFALFVSFFPQVIQGPISRFDDLSQTLFKSHYFNSEDALAGLRRIMWGFFKKLVIADRMLIAVRAMSTEEYTGAFVLLNMLFYAVTLYSDFTGGIDITIGIARVMGIRVKENFDRPFYSKNIAEYWRRWHITMGTWFKDYLFYPLSVSKPMLKFSKLSRDKLGNGFGRRLPVYVSTIVVWFATGLWHGADWNFIVWGLANGVVIILSQECEPLYAAFHKRFNVAGKWWHDAFQVVRTFWLMCFIRAFDVYRDVPLTFRMFGSIFTESGASWSGIGLGAEDYVVAALGCGAMIAVGVIAKRRPRLLDERPELSLSLCSVLLVVTLVFGIYGIGYDATQFIYNQF